MVSINRWVSVMLIGLMTLSTIGCSKNQSAKAPQTVAVKAMKVIQKDTPINYEFVGEIEAQDEVQIRSTVSGNIVEKMVKGGDKVYKGQPLFRIDSRTYTSALLNYQAQMAEAEAALSRIRRDVIRYQSLAAQGAIAQQVLDNALAEEQQAMARVEANAARVQQAQNDLGDTVIVSPLDGKIDIKDLSVGNFVQAGQTVLANISTVNPVRVKFNMSENEYLRLAGAKNGGDSIDNWDKVKLVLSDGSQYPFLGRVEQVDRAMNHETGTLTLKAVFDNPQKILVPGMFARVIAEGEIRQQALLIPQKAVQEMLGKTFVTVVTADNKAESRPVKMGPRIGNLWLVEEGLQADDIVIVDGFIKTPPGTPLQVTMIELADLNVAEQK